MPFSREAVVRWCGWLGLLLVTLYVLQSLRSAPSMSELLLVVQPVARLPLDTLRRTGLTSVVFRIPVTKEWNDFRQEWGEPSYLVFVHDRERFVQPFQELDLIIRASANGQTLAMTSATQPPYLYSSNTRDYGVVFKADPGAEIRVDVGAKDRLRLPDAELVIEPQWPGSLKDRIVAAMLDESLVPYVTTAGLVGILLVLIALVAAQRRPGS